MTVNLYPLDKACFETRPGVFLCSWELSPKFLYVPVKPKLCWKVNCSGQDNHNKFADFYLVALLSSNGSCSPRQTTLRFYDILNGYVVLHWVPIHAHS